MNKQPLLSICIPTYNRADYLDKTLATILPQAKMAYEEVEVIVSDNASTDNTYDIVKKYQSDYDCLYYSKNIENIKDRNFPTVIGLAHGVYRKLCNDTLLFNDNSIINLLVIIKQFINNRQIIFFSNTSPKHDQKVIDEIDSLDNFVRYVSFRVTWIGSFGIWEEDFYSIINKFDMCESRLWQSSIVFQLFEKKARAIIINTQLFSNQEVTKKDLSYGLYTVFYENYLKLYDPYISKQLITQKTITYLRKDLLMNFFSNWVICYYINEDRFIIRDNKFIRKLCIQYIKEYYFIIFFIKILFTILIRFLQRIKRMFIGLFVN